MSGAKTAPAPVSQAQADPPSRAGALWDPVPITMPTYVSKPLAPRTVRTIDLSGPTVAARPPDPVPVTADPPEPGPMRREPTATSSARQPRVPAPVSLRRLLTSEARSAEPAA